MKSIYEQDIAKAKDDTKVTYAAAVVKTGRFTIEEAAELFKVTVDQIRAELGLIPRGGNPRRNVGGAVTNLGF